jgi:hypothetical protein
MRTEARLYRQGINSPGTENNEPYRASSKSSFKIHDKARKGTRSVVIVIKL